MSDEPRYRVGRHLGRTIYDGDTLIGIMDTPELGAEVVSALNARYRVLATPPRQAPDLTQPVQHNHVTREIRAPGTCPACDRTHQGMT